jgi:KDO2-lipid IV(A) lauroyltransferase
VANGFPLTAIVRESYDPRFDRVVDAARGSASVPTIARGAPGAATRIVRALRSGRVLGIPMDLRTRAESVVVPLLGIPAPTPVGPARIALRVHAPVVVCTVEPVASQLEVTCTRLSARESSPESLTAHINEELSRRIRLAPEHWLWMHARYGFDER